MLGRLLKELFGAAGPATPAVPALDAGIAAHAAGDHAAAARLFDAAIADSPRHAEAWFRASLVAYDTGSYDKALSLIEQACALEPANAQYCYYAGAAHWKLGQGEAARTRCEQALEISPKLGLAYTLMAEITLPGPGYLELLAAIHQTLRPRTYIEIGVLAGSSLALVLPETRAIGIDPKPQIRAALTGRTSIHACASDSYFANHDVCAEFGGLPIDLAFIDGMHHFEFALRDFIHIERRCTPQSTILIHDCFPCNRLTAERERECGFWSGDIWRLVLLLKKYRPELIIRTIATAPTGLGVVRGLDPTSSVLEDHLEAAIAEFMAVDFSVLDEDKAGMLNRYPNDWDSLRRLFV